MYGYSEGVRCGNVHGLRRLVACPLPRLALGVGHPVGVIPAAHARHEVDGGSTRDAGEGAVHRERGQRRAFLGTSRARRLARRKLAQGNKLRTLSHCHLSPRKEDVQLHALRRARRARPLLRRRARRACPTGPWGP